jgi:N-dimethylarginine dimethylaminohydrolase
MSPPTYYGIEYEINPWMNMERGVDPVRSQVQWQSLHELLQMKLGVEVLLVDPQVGLPDLVFTANAGLVTGGKAILSRFRYPQRAGEESHFSKWFHEHGLTVVELPGSGSFEGEGDARSTGNRLFGGYGLRSDKPALEAVAEISGRALVSVELVDPFFYHLDTCFCPLSPDLAIYYPPAFARESLARLVSEVPNLIEVSEHDARLFGCNAVVIEQDVVVNAGCDDLTATLTEHGFNVHQLQLDEFIKAGGSAKCLVLFLDNC